MQHTSLAHVLRVVLAPDSFKGSLPADEVAAALARGMARCTSEPWPGATIDCLPMADGGEGTAAALVAATGGKFVSTEATDALGRPVRGKIGVLGDGRTAVIDVAEVSGLTLIRVAERNPLRATSRGTGQLIRAALRMGFQRIIVGAGGSATNDGAMGLAQALGVQFLDAHGAELGEGGGELHKLARIDTSNVDPRLANVQLIVAADVDNPLLGPRGATHVYAPQKGADPSMVEQLEAGMAHFAETVQRQLGVDVASRPGAGSAGGIGAGLMALFGAQWQSGFNVVSETIGLARYVEQAHLVITGEGRIDGQTAHGKVAAGVGKLGRQYGVPVIAIAGEVTADAEVLVPDVLQALIPIVQGPATLADAIAQSRHNIEQTGQRIAALFSLGGRFISGGK